MTQDNRERAGKGKCSEKEGSVDFRGNVRDDIKFQSV